MGTINYGTSKYITMGLIPEHEWDYVTDKVCFHEMQELAEEWNCDVHDAILQNIHDNLMSDYENVDWYLQNKYSFQFFDVSIEWGYYEGFWIKIDDSCEVFDDYTQKREAQKEITKLKQFLLDIHDCGIVSVWPGWCTTYRDRKETEADIAEAIRGMREAVRRAPTWRTWNPRLF